MSNKTASSRNRGTQKKLEDFDNYYGVAWNRYSTGRKKSDPFYDNDELCKILELTVEELEQLFEDGLRKQNVLKAKKVHIRDVIDHLLRMEKTHFANKMALNEDEGAIVHDYTSEVEARRISEVKKAQLSMLEVDKLKANVYEAPEVIREVVVAASTVKSAVLAIENLAPQLEDKDAGEIRKILKDELRVSMDALAGYLRESA